LGDLTVQSLQRVHDVVEPDQRRPGGWRRSGAASTAQASDAQDARIARFSCVVISGSLTTSMGTRKAPAGWRRRSRSKSFRFSVCMMAISLEKRHGSKMSGKPRNRPGVGHLSADRFRKTEFDFKRSDPKFCFDRVQGFRSFCAQKFSSTALLKRLVGFSNSSTAAPGCGVGRPSKGPANGRQISVWRTL